MKDLIDRYKLVKRFVMYGREIDKEQVLEVVMSIPKEDAVEVVHCKDCKHWHEWENGTGTCQRAENSCFWFGVDFDDYCSFGERSEE